MGLVPMNTDRRQGRPHSLARCEMPRGPDLTVRILSGLSEGRGPVRAIRRERASEDFDDQSAGHLAGCVTTHAVGDRKEDGLRYWIEGRLLANFEGICI